MEKKKSLDIWFEELEQTQLNKKLFKLSVETKEEMSPSNCNCNCNCGGD